jgi:hypothetical protein
MESEEQNQEFYHGPVWVAIVSFAQDLSASPRTSANSCEYDQKGGSPMKELGHARCWVGSPKWGPGMGYPKIARVKYRLQM